MTLDKQHYSDKPLLDKGTVVRKEHLSLCSSIVLPRTALPSMMSSRDRLDSKASSVLLAGDVC